MLWGAKPRSCIRWWQIGHLQSHSWESEVCARVTELRVPSVEVTVGERLHRNK